MTNIQDLSIDILRILFSYLNISTQTNLFQVDRIMYQLKKEIYYWKLNNLYTYLYIKNQFS